MALAEFANFLFFVDFKVKEPISGIRLGFENAKMGLQRFTASDIPRDRMYGGHPIRPRSLSTGSIFINNLGAIMAEDIIFDYDFELVSIQINLQDI